MTEKLTHCPECHSENLDNSVYCCQCGSPMRKGIPENKLKRPGISTSRIITVIAITLVLNIILTSGILFFNSSESSRQSTLAVKKVTQKKEAPVRKKEIKPVTQSTAKENASLPDKILPETKEVKEVEGLTVGSVSIINPEGITVTQFPAPVVGGSWLALPTRACIGGDKWYFTTGNNKPVPIEGGLWSRGDSVGFWQLAGDVKMKGPEITTWQQEEPVTHLSTETGRLSEPMVLEPSSLAGAFIYSSQPDTLDPGVFLQNGKVVGWSFGELLGGAYMWTLGSGANLLYQNYVDDFYNETFAGGREEFFSTALLERSDASPQTQLQVFIEGFRVPAKLSPKDTPRYLSADVVNPYVSKLVGYIMDQRRYQYIALLAEEPLLWEINDQKLIKNVALATQKIYGPEEAANFLEQTITGIEQEMEGEEQQELDAFHLEIYLGWIKDLLDSGYTARGWQTFNRAKPLFSESPELHLLAVELALSAGDWEEAEVLLYQREYPTKLRETKMLLTESISELKGQENKIVIRFQAGSREIPVGATLNENMDQDFLVDTGASFVTIPYSTVETLGLEDEMSDHQLEVQTAGGPVQAKAVTLASIELQGWIVPDVKALVMDLPNRPGLGLLGLNFLNSFRVDLQADQGLLILEPK